MTLQSLNRESTRVLTSQTHSHTSASIPLEQVEAYAASNGVVAHLEAEAAEETNGTGGGDDGEAVESEGNDEEVEEADEEEEDSEDVCWTIFLYGTSQLTFRFSQDVEIIMEPPSRSLDFRYSYSAYYSKSAITFYFVGSVHSLAASHSHSLHQRSVRSAYHLFYFFILSIL